MLKVYAANETNLNQATQHLVHAPRIERKILGGVVLSIKIERRDKKNNRTRGQNENIFGKACKKCEETQRNVRK